MNTTRVDFIRVWDEFRNGNEKAFSLLYETYFYLLYRYGIKFVTDENIVKDSIQDLFIKLHNNKNNLSATDNPKFYLLYSLKNLLIDNIARYKRVTYISPEELPFIAVYEYESMDDSNGIDDETKRQFDKVISLLNPRQEEALYLRFQLELSYEEISELLGINYQSARNLIHRSISKIRENMDITLFITLFIKALQ